MNSLRNRIALLLIVAIIAVVGLATLVTNRSFQGPPPDNLSPGMAGPLAILVRVAEASPQAASQAGLTIKDMPYSQAVDERMSAPVAQALASAGLRRDVLVSLIPNRMGLNVSVRLQSGGWLVVPLPDDRPPPDGGPNIGVWIALITAGSVLVAIFAATKIVRPLEMLEGAVQHIGPDGTLVELLETGPVEIRATARALNTLSRRLRDAMDSRLRVVAAAGHDLRTPLTRMRLRAEFITDDEEREKWLRDLEELEAIADSAIRLAREQANREASSPVDLSALLCEITDELVDLGHGDNLTLEVPDTPLIVRATPLALKRALRNLVINALTHGKQAKIGMKRLDTSAIVTIEDAGPGIPEEMMQRIFEPFFRVDPARRKSLPGAGLGLAIAKEIIERCNGSITMANCKPKGLLQTVCLPLAS